MALVNTHAKTFMAVLGSCFLFACEAVTENPSLEAAEASKELVDKVSAGIRPLENKLAKDQSVEILFYLNNATDDAIEVLPWATPLEANISADLFKVSKGEERLPYIGRVVKRAAPEASDYITIEAGQKREVVLNLNLAYDMRGAGEYTIEFERLNLQDPKGLVDTVIVDSTVVVARD